MSAYVNSELIAETAWLADHVNDHNLAVVDVRWPTAERGGRAAYLEGHIPGAVYLDVTSDLADPDDPVAMQLAPPDRFAAAMSSAGIGDQTIVVAYDDAGGAVAARLWWALLYYGHREAKILNGGIRQWKAEGRPLTGDTPSPPPRKFTARALPELRSTLEDVRAARDDGNVLILDARIAAQFRGEQPGGAPRAGHIPGSVNVPFTRTFMRGTQTLLPADELAALYERAGAFARRRVITTCGTGVAAAGALFHLRLLGYKNASVYDGSWDEWSRHPELPAATGDATGNE
ncbi:MAG TPA: sulfurtransferase [Candidatus Binataceae bacterium]|nr:sulfurtransferase [Candidatus Binataceae bacterium]